ncbi:condensation domain-containing protein [Catenulispora subtropica]|uniref:Carrier domain-containing protein n=1 Tax=Catenulispora subtropica TaxID=450798 RepID=A0ABN2SR95_9ACTN
MPSDKETAVTDAPATYALELFCLLGALGRAAVFDPAFTIRAAVRLSGPVDPDVLRQALDDVVGNHDALHSTLTLEPEIRQCVQAPTPVRLTVRDLEDADHGGDRNGRQQADRDQADRYQPGRDQPHRDQTGRDRVASAFVAETVAGRFPPDELPTLWAALGRLAADDWVLVLVTHHLWSDAWSMRVILADLAAAYAARAEGEVPELSEGMAYAAVAEDDRSPRMRERIDERLGYWRERLADMDSPLRPENPYSEIRDGVKAEHTFVLGGPGEASLEAVLACARRNRTTPFVVLLSAFMLWLRAATGSEDIAVPIVTAGRLPEEWETVGLFSNSIVMRADLAAAVTGRDVLRTVHAVCAEAYRHEIPLLRLLEEVPRAAELVVDPDRALPMFQLIQFPDGRGGQAFGPDVQARPIEMPGDSANAQLPDYLWTLELGDRLVGRVYSDPKTFGATTIERQTQEYRRILDQLVRDPDAALAGLGPRRASRDERELESEYTAPRTAAEADLAELWSEQLGVAPVGIHDDFFELGGHSLLAAGLQLEIERRFGVEVPSWVLFLQPTIAGIAEALAEAGVA